MQKSDDSGHHADPEPRRRGRPRAFDRDAALAKAVRLFWTRGFEATSITDLTAELGIGAPSLYAAFGSKEALYAEALQRYARDNEAYVWAEFGAAATAREAVRSLLSNSAAALTGCVADLPRGCMVTLSQVGSEGHEALGELVRAARAVTLERLLARLETASAAGEIPAAADRRALARYVQTIQVGMSILARDGATGDELQAVADVAIEGWDARLASCESTPD
ncbi:TetR family transcriptional regulator [Aureimonas endophytica]|uniref:TetR family transcriptional regulator n=1 Tax=Aureimonas endophytica TaxID=2027858 RepID=A0A916ZLL3_9HYPH|nr:TetR/AcrR family transcriptional regulator [Aureimonas endophytica]GGE03588.1 TetR family transcriptional regulator [Aureimonas endophytica]